MRGEFCAGSTIQEIAARHNLPMERVRAWAHRHGWRKAANASADAAVPAVASQALAVALERAQAASESAAPRHAQSEATTYAPVTTAQALIALHSDTHRSHLLAAMAHARACLLAHDKHGDVRAWSELLVYLVETDRRHLSMLDPEKRAERDHKLSVAVAEGASAIQAARALAVAEAVVPEQPEQADAVTRLVIQDPGSVDG
jgi:hypothetical protein